MILPDKNTALFIVIVAIGAVIIDYTLSDPSLADLVTVSLNALGNMIFRVGLLNASVYAMMYLINRVGNHELESIGSDPIASSIFVAGVFIANALAIIG